MSAIFEDALKKRQTCHKVNFAPGEQQLFRQSCIVAVGIQRFIQTEIIDTLGNY